MSHSFVYVTGPHGQLIRACQNCISTAVFNSNSMTWEVVKEETGHRILGTAECEDSPSNEEPKKGLAAVDSAARRATVATKRQPCYCTDCKGKHSHYDDDDNCYCKSCRGRKTHY